MSTLNDLARAVHAALDLPRAADSPGRQTRLEQMATRVAAVKGTMRFLAECEDPGEADVRRAIESLAQDAGEDLWYRPAGQPEAGS